MKRLDLKIANLSIDQLQPYSNNAKQHSAKQIKLLARNIAEFGFVGPIVIDEEHVILAGHGRYAAAKLLALNTVPVITLRHLSEGQKRAYRIADNRLG